MLCVVFEEKHNTGLGLKRDIDDKNDGVSPTCNSTQSSCSHRQTMEDGYDGERCLGYMFDSLI